MPGPFTYYANIPQATDQISQSQQQILDNFDSINELIQIDHATFTSANAGKHNKVTFVQLGASPATSSTELVFYNKDVSGSPQVHLRRQSSGQEIPFTQKGIRLDGGANDNRHVWSYLPSGMLTMSGRVTSGASGNVTVTFSANASFPPFNPSFFPIVTATVNDSTAGSTSTVRVTSLSNLAVTFQVLINTTGTSGIPLFYTATGYL